MSSQSEPGPHAAATAQGGGREAPAEAQGVEPFTLDITFSGLVLLVEQADKLLVLLPHAHEHQGGEHPGHDMPEHLAVLGTQRRYSPTGPFIEKGQFFECELTMGKLEFDPPLVPSKPEFDLDAFDVVDLTPSAKGPPLPERARIRLDVTGGAVCRECAHDSGVRWEFRGGREHMATRLSWRIPNITTVVGDRAGVGVVFRSDDGSVVQEFVVRPRPDPSGGGQNRAVIYLYNTPEDELPSHLGHPRPPGDIDGNVHFAAYYSLFEPRITEPLPVLVKTDEPDEPDAEDDTDEHGDKFISDRAASRLKRRQGFHGRLYTCTLARTAEFATTSSSTATNGVEDA